MEAKYLEINKSQFYAWQHEVAKRCSGSWVTRRVQICFRPLRGRVQLGWSLDLPKCPFPHQPMEMAAWNALSPSHYDRKGAETVHMWEPCKMMIRSSQCDGDRHHHLSRWLKIVPGVSQGGGVELGPDAFVAISPFLPSKCCNYSVTLQLPLNNFQNTAKMTRM